MDALVEFADLAKVEMETPREKQEIILRDLHARGIRVVSEKVETDADFRWALRAGYDYFQGNFFACPVVMQGTEIPAIKMHCLRLIQEAHRAELDFTRLTALISQDVSLSYKLLRYANSARFGRQGMIHSIRRALVVLGEYGIRKWIAVAANRCL